MTNQKNHSFYDIDPALCTLCGTCVGVCPYDVLIVTDEKVSLVSECKRCGLCYAVCPGINVDFLKLNKFLFGVTECDEYIGYYRMIARGHTSDECIRDNASAGGVVTGLLLFLLETGLIDGAIIVGTSDTNPLQPEVKIARNSKDIIDGSQSKYCLIPVNKILHALHEEKGRFAFVGLPCHIHGLRNLQLLGSPEIKKIAVMIGLYCGFNMKYEGTEYLIKKLGIEKKDIIKLNYRGGKYPGGFNVKTRTREYFLGKHIYNILNPLFVPDRCLLCPDLMNEFADISIGDIWKGYDGKGWSSIIIRTQLGEDLFKNSIENNYLISEYLSYGDLISSHNHLITYKKEQIYARLKMKNTVLEYNLNCDQPYSIRIKGVFFAYLLWILRSDPIKTFSLSMPLWVMDILARLINMKIRKRG